MVDEKEEVEMKTRWISHVWLVLLLASMSVLVGCGGGSDGNNGKNGADGAPGATGETGAPGADGKSAYEVALDQIASGGDLNEQMADALGVGPEQCVYCHNGEVARNGITHQEVYDDLFQQDVVEVSNVAYSNDGTNDTVTFNMTKNGDAFDCTALNNKNADGSGNSLNIYYSQYTNTSPSNRWGTDLNGDGAGDRISLKGTVTYDAGTNTCTSVNAQTTLGDLAATNGLLVVYGENEILDTSSSTPLLAGSHINLGRYPFSGYEILGTVDYDSAANATGCENCHEKPYYKHGYIRGDISAGGGLDFYACKACHLDNGNGGHIDWQISVDNPQRWAEIFNGSAHTDAENTQYAYKTRLMNDVHMSHSMEFPYPQPIRTCATCHEGKLDRVLSDENFTLETCLSCHPVTGGTDTADSKGNFTVDTTKMALKTYWANKGVSDLHVLSDGSVTATPCNSCHAKGSVTARVFSDIHTGYDPQIYYKDADGNYQHYRDAITASIDSVTLSDNVLDIKFSASASANGIAAGLSADDVKPTVQVSFYGYDTKDFILSNHTSNKAGLRMEKTIGTDNALFTEVVGTAPNWEVTLDLAAYASDPADFDIVANIASGVIKKAEVIVRPALMNADKMTVGLNAVSKTVDVTADGTDQFVDNYFQGTNALVKVAKVDASTGESGCNSCHDQLAITFHSGDRGGNIVVCRSCHVVTSGGSHLEGQSRSIDSYVHAIHRFQPFNLADPTDPVEVAKYAEHSEFLFPDFAAVNCERCHTVDRAVDAGSRKAFDIPDQSKSMPGLLSKSSVGGTPELVTGPAPRACGGCHRAEFTKEGDTTGYVTFIEHTKRFGYAVENDDSGNMLYAVIRYMMGLFQ
jgi:hypothetical protein